MDVELGSKGEGRKWKFRERAKDEKEILGRGRMVQKQQKKAGWKKNNVEV